MNIKEFIVIMAIGFALSYAINANSDVIERKLTDKDIADCMYVANLAAIVQQYTNKGEAPPEQIEGYEDWQVGIVIHQLPLAGFEKGTHPAYVKKHLLSHCTKYVYDSKPEYEYGL